MAGVDSSALMAEGRPAVRRSSTPASGGGVKAVEGTGGGSQAAVERTRGVPPLPSLHGEVVEPLMLGSQVGGGWLRQARRYGGLVSAFSGTAGIGSAAGYVRALNSIPGGREEHLEESRTLGRDPTCGEPNQSKAS